MTARAVVRTVFIIDTLTTLAHRAGASYGWLTMRAPSIPQGDSMVEAL